jgi:hypothetical protein
VVVDGEDKGPAPWEGEIAAGEHTIELKSPRYASEQRRMRIVAKQRLEIVLDAAPLTGHLRVTTLPASATISVDGKPVGTGVWEGDLSEGTHRVEAALEGQTPQIRDIVVARGQNIVQEIPVAIGVTPADYVGLYVKWTLHTNFAASGLPDNEIPDAPSTGINVNKTNATLVALGTSIRVGRSFGIFGGEVVGRVFFEHRDQTLDVAIPPPNPTRKLALESNAGNFFFGAGPRVTSKAETVRFTFGIAPGIAIRNFTVRVHEDNDGGSGGGSGQSTFVQGGQGNGPSTPENEFPNAGYTALAFASDFGVLFGSTPGTKFFLGVDMWIDFPPGDIIVGPDIRSNIPASAYRAPGRGVFIVNGTQFYIGPTLGVQFGH